MRQMQIIKHMIDVVENYIYIKKNVYIHIDMNRILVEQRQLDMLIDAFNHVKKEGYYGN